MHPGKILPMSPGRYTSSRACTLACGLAVWEHADAARAPACSSWRNPHQGCRCMHLVVNAVQQLSFAGPRTSAKQQSSMIYLPYKQVGPPSTKRPLVLHTPKLVMALQNIVRKGALELSSAVRAVSSTAVSHGVLSHVEPAPKVQAVLSRPSRNAISATAGYNQTSCAGPYSGNHRELSG
jgi:hypothetical protein